MIPINELQAKIYQSLSELEIKVYDEVPQEASMPLITIGDYILSSYEFKGEGYSFNWTLSIYTEYEGKKEVNQLVSKTIECVYKLIGLNLSENYCIDDVLLDEASVSRNEGYYVANLSIKIDIL